MEYKEAYSELKRSIEEGLLGRLLATDSPLPAPNSQFPPVSWSDLSDADLFAHLREIIEREKLFLNPGFERQTLIDRTGLTKERISAAFTRNFKSKYGMTPTAYKGTIAKDLHEGKSHNFLPTS